MGRIADMVACMRGARLSEIVEAIAKMEEEAPVARQGTPRAALMAVLDAEHADAVLEHRQRMRKPLTERAAKLLAGQLRECPDPNAAADAMLLNGWRGCKPEWLTQSNARGSPVAPKVPSQADVFEFIGRNSTSDTRPDYSDSSGFRQAIPHIREVGSQR